jgi:hypothetical protein
MVDSAAVVRSGSASSKDDAVSANGVRLADAFRAMWLRNRLEWLTARVFA